MINVLINHTTQIIFIIEDSATAGLRRIEDEQCVSDVINKFVNVELPEFVAMLDAHAPADFKRVYYKIGPKLFEIQVTFKSDNADSVFNAVKQFSKCDKTQVIYARQTVHDGCHVDVKVPFWGDISLQKY